MVKINVIIGDLHGTREEFEELLKLISYNQNTMRLVLTGDFLHRGPNQADLVRFIRSLKIESVKGNHEESGVRWIKHHKTELLTGKKNPMKVYSELDKSEAVKLSDDDWDWISKLPLSLHIKDNIHVVHAGAEPRLPFSKQMPAQVMRVRYVDENGYGKSLNSDKSQPNDTIFWAERWKGPESLIYGHVVHNEFKTRLDQYENHFCLGIDTGCVFGGYLTAAILSDKIEFAQVKAKQEYCKL